MLKKRVKYEGFDGEIIEEDLYFNMTRMDLIELNSKYGEKDMSSYIDEVVKKKDVSSLYKVLKDIVLVSYGVKSEDGKRFIKNEKVREEFNDSLAFAQLIEDFHSTEDGLLEFITAVTKNIKGLDNKPLTT